MVRVSLLLVLGLITSPLLAHDLSIERDTLAQTLLYAHERSGH